jgi:DNA polymerase-3 subunit delta
MSNTIHAFDYLDDPQRFTPKSVCAVFGDEPLLRRLVRQALQTQLVADEGGELATTFAGDRVAWRDVVDELSTYSLFGGGGPRLVVIEEADDFVTKHRPELESYVERPKRTGILMLDVQKWAGNTRLFQSIDRSGLQIECRAPQKASGRRKVLDEGRLAQWLANRCRNQHQAKLQAGAARLMIELVGPELGLLDQELAKLALFAGADGTVTTEMVRDVVGGWRTKTTWELIDAAVEGRTGDALRQLDRMLQTGEHPLALLGPLAWSLRRFAAATRIYEGAERQGNRIPLRTALEQAGFRKWPAGALENAERQLKRMGRQRASSFYSWLREADRKLKGSHSAPTRARFVLEELILRLATPTPVPQPER